MPTFPTYGGPPLPAALNPLNPRHYLLLLEWIYLKPSRLKHYLHQADPDIYSGKTHRFERPLRSPTYRNLIVIVTVMAIVFSVIIIWITSLTSGIAVQWAPIVMGSLSQILIVPRMIRDGKAKDLVWELTLGIVFGVSCGVGIQSDIKWILSSYVLLAIICFSSMEAPGIIPGIVLSVLLGIVASIKKGIGTGCAVSTGTMLGTLRLPFYLFELVPALWALRRSPSPAQRLARHPVMRDELAVLPFPGLPKLLTAALAEDWDAGLHAAFVILRNPFQRHVAGKAFAARWHTGNEFLPEFYRVLQDPQADFPLRVPETETELSIATLAGIMWLGEIGQTCTGTQLPRHLFASDRFVWRLSHLGNKPHPQAAPLARFLLHMATDDIKNKNVSETLLNEARAAVRDLPHGAEVAGSLTILETMARAVNLEAVAQIHRMANILPPADETAIRPVVMVALRDLLDVSSEVRLARQASTPEERAAALSRATETLTKVAGHITQIRVPEREPLSTIHALWQGVVTMSKARW